jgi:hypothetical protein
MGRAEPTYALGPRDDTLLTKRVGLISGDPEL